MSDLRKTIDVFLDKNPNDVEANLHMADIYEEEGSTAWAMAHRMVARREVILHEDLRARLGSNIRWDIFFPTELLKSPAEARKYEKVEDINGEVVNHQTIVPDGYDYHVAIKDVPKDWRRKSGPIRKYLILFVTTQLTVK